MARVRPLSGPIPYGSGTPATVVIPAGPFDPGALSRRIDEMVAAVPKDEHGRLLLDWTPDRTALGLLWRGGGGHVQVLGQLVKERGRGWDPQVSASVSFAAEMLPKPEPWSSAEVEALLRARHPRPKGIAAGVVALVKRWVLEGGRQVYA